MIKQWVLLMTPFSFEMMGHRPKYELEVKSKLAVFLICLCTYVSPTLFRLLLSSTLHHFLDKVVSIWSNFQTKNKIKNSKVVFIFSFLLPWLRDMADSSNLKESGHDKAHMVRYGLCTNQSLVSDQKKNQSLVQYRPFYIKRSCKLYFPTLYSLLILLLYWLLWECVQGTTSSSTL